MSLLMRVPAEVYRTSGLSMWAKRVTKLKRNKRSQSAHWLKRRSHPPRSSNTLRRMSIVEGDDGTTLE
jgi:hypothetical protein